MEVRPKIEPYGDGWKCACEDAIGVADTPGDAYAAWLKAFNYQGPPLPLDSGVINCAYEKERT